MESSCHRIPKWDLAGWVESGFVPGQQSWAGPTRAHAVSCNWMEWWVLRSLCDRACLAPASANHKAYRNVVSCASYSHLHSNVGSSLEPQFSLKNLALVLPIGCSGAGLCWLIIVIKAIQRHKIFYYTVKLKMKNFPITPQE